VWLAFMLMLTPATLQSSYFLFTRSSPNKKFLPKDDEKSSA
jgi:hypothetical protein